ncbi:DUF2628 domain-containing protein [Devosia sp.]|uniref:DUF2628 domain-containing protein n=1 Tax=Devosia sp. TaxID=1871048 RepID=UPI0035B483E0
MTLHSVYDRPDAAPVAVADRFSLLAALLPPVYALLHGLWLLLVAWVLLLVALTGLSALAGADAAFWIYAALAVLIGLEAPTLRRRRLGRLGFRYRTEILAPDEDLAALAWLQRR